MQVIFFMESILPQLEYELFEGRQLLSLSIFVKFSCDRLGINFSLHPVKVILFFLPIPLFSCNSFLIGSPNLEVNTVSHSKSLFLYFNKSKPTSTLGLIGLILKIMIFSEDNHHNPYNINCTNSVRENCKI